MHFGPLDAKLFGLAVDAFTTGALEINGLVERTCPIQGHTGLTAQFPVDILDTSLAFRELGVSAVFSLGDWKEQRTAEALRPLAVGMAKLKGGLHAQPYRAQGDAISSTFINGMPMLVEWDRRDAAVPGCLLVDIPGIKSGISGQIHGERLQGCHSLLIEWTKVGDIPFIERLGVFS